MDSQGGNAANNGDRAQRLIRELLLMQGLRPVHNIKTVNGLLQSKRTLFPVPGQFLEQCQVPLVAPYHQGKNRAIVVDFGVLSKTEEVILFSIKSQSSNGTAEQKLEFEIRRLIATELPSIMFVHGPLRGRDGPTGWSPDVLEEIWERSRQDGGDRVFLFRKEEKLIRYVRDGMPVPGRGLRSSDIWAMYCDREP